MIPVRFELFLFVWEESVGKLGVRRLCCDVVARKFVRKWKVVGVWAIRRYDIGSSDADMGNIQRI